MASEEKAPEVDEYDGPWFDRRIVWQCPDNGRHTVVLFGSWSRFEKEEELTYEGKSIYAVTTKVPLGSYEYRFRIDDEEWETNDNAAKTVKDGDEYNTITVKDDNDNSDNDDEEDEENTASDANTEDNTQLIWDEQQRKLVVGKTKKGKRGGRGKPSMELDLGANFADEAEAGDDEDNTDKPDDNTGGAGADTATTGDAGKKKKKKKKTKKYTTGKDGVNIEKEKEWARYVYVQQMKQQQEHNDEINRVKSMWKQERQVRAGMQKKVLQEKKELEKELTAAKTEIERLEKLNKIGNDADKKLISLLENEKKQLETDLESARAELKTANDTIADMRKAKVESMQSKEEDQKQMADLSGQLEAIRTEKDAKITELEGNVTKLRGEIGEKSKQLNNTEAKVAELENSLESQQKQFANEKDNYEKRLATDNEKGQKIGATCLKLKQQFESVREEMKAIKTQKISQLEEMVNAFNEFSPVLGKVFTFNQSMVDDLMQKYKRELTLRRKYFNIVQDLRGNIRVFCRVRPILPFEIQKGDTSCLSFPNPGKIVVEDEKQQTHNFEFDQVYAPGTTQEAVSEDTTEYIQSVMDGYNVSIFAYGQTGSGKTYTMDGSHEEPGVNLRALKHLFKMAEERAPQFEYKIKVSIFEIYNEDIRDLLLSEKKQKTAGKLKILHLPDGSVQVKDLTWKTVKSDEDVVALGDMAKSRRTAGVTDMNAHSSRSHMVMVVNVKGFNLPANIEYIGKLYLVDLAGSERVKKSGATGQAMKEAQNINKSLAALGDVMQALQKKEKFIPYRNSTLTDLMTNSLGGNAKTVMFINCCPTARHAFETVSSLKFASRVGKVELGQAKAKAKQKKKKAAS